MPPTNSYFLDCDFILSIAIPGERGKNSCFFIVDFSIVWIFFRSKFSDSNLPRLKELHSICVTLIEKLRENEFPLETTVNVIGLLEARPMSTYTAKSHNRYLESDIVNILEFD